MATADRAVQLVEQSHRESPELVGGALDDKRGLPGVAEHRRLVVDLRGAQLGALSRP
jgi:hypothetical protein